LSLVTNDECLNHNDERMTIPKIPNAENTQAIGHFAVAALRVLALSGAQGGASQRVRASLVIML